MSSLSEGSNPGVGSANRGEGSMADADVLPPVGGPGGGPAGGLWPAELSTSVVLEPGEVLPPPVGELFLAVDILKAYTQDGRS